MLSAVVDLAVTQGQEEYGMRVSQAKDTWVETCLKIQVRASSVPFRVRPASFV